MTAVGDITLDDLLELCPFRSIIGPPGADLLTQHPRAVVAVPEPGMPDPAPDVLEQLLHVLRTGGTVLVLAAEAGDRLRIRQLLGAVRVERWGTA